jgi:hypothetical protein
VFQNTFTSLHLFTHNISPLHYTSQHFTYLHTTLHFASQRIEADVVVVVVLAAVEEEEEQEDEEEQNL